MSDKENFNGGTEENNDGFKPIDERTDEEIHGRIEVVNIDKEMRSSYLDYAMSVIVGRALPDVRDGMKPVHRRVIYAMYDGGYRPDRGYNKCSRVVGDVMGKYHPHGDVAIYDTLVRMVQEWTLRYPIVDGQGNFGSESEPKAAAPRYTECRMAKLSMELVRDIDKNTVDFEPNYDGKDNEPTVLPSRYPNLLVNGSSGIAVGMATNIPPHNLKEVAEGAKFLLDNPEIGKEELLEHLLKIIKGPDFPTGAIIYGVGGINSAYRTGRGIIKMRARIEIEEEKSGRVNLVVTELPYQVKPDVVLEKIVQVHKDKIIEGIASVDDFSSGRTGLRIVIGLKREANAKVVLAGLYKYTSLQESFGANMLALVEGVPRTLSLDAFIRHWVDHQIEVVVRRTKWLLDQAKERAHILEGYLKALDVIDEVIALIRGSKDRNEAKEKLIPFLKISEIQADAILELRLHRLAALELQKIQDEYNELQNKINDYTDIIATPQRQRTIVKDELSEIVDKFGDDRRTEIIPGELDANLEDLIQREEIVITVSKDGYIKRTSLDEYRATKRGAVGVKGVKVRDEDAISHFQVQSTHDWLLMFTDKGRVFKIKGYEVPTASRDSKGSSINNLIEMESDEKLAIIMNLATFKDKQHIVLATKNGIIKKTKLELFEKIRKSGLRAINLKIDERGKVDQLVSAALVNDNEHIILISKNGQCIKFVSDDKHLKPTGRTSSGNIGIRFKDNDDCLVSMDVVEFGDFILTVTNNGYAKRSYADDYRMTNRGGKGVKVAKFDDKRGELAGGIGVKEDEELLVLLNSGKVVRSKVSEIPVKGRATMGVIFAKPADDDFVVKVTSSKLIEDENEVEDENSNTNKEETNS